MSREKLLTTVLADLRNGEPPGLLIEEKAILASARIGGTENRMRIGWSPYGIIKRRMHQQGSGDLAPKITFAEPIKANSPVCSDLQIEEQHEATYVPNEQVWKGVENLLDDYTGLRADDFVVVAYTPDSRTAAAWILTALKDKQVEHRHVAMLPVLDSEFLERLSRIVPRPSNLTKRLVILTVEHHSMSHHETLRTALMPYDPRQWLAVRITGASEEFFTYSMQESKAVISARNVALLEKFMKARTMRITTRRGSDLHVALNSDRFKWISNRGSCRPGGFIVLPPGEVATYPESIDGIFVADGAININILTDIDSRLAASPVKIRLKDGKAVKHSCANPHIANLLDACFAVPNMDQVGELGFGTNCGIPKFIPDNTHINERRTGVHLGFGQSNQSPDVVNYWVDLHMDLISDGAQIWLDNDCIPLDLDDIPLSSAKHPSVVLDEDIDGDCCGPSLI